MPAKREAAMGTNDSNSAGLEDQKCFASGRSSKRRKGNATVNGQRKPVLNARAPVDDNKVSMVPCRGSLIKKGYRKDFVEEDAPLARLVKIELDAAQALAEFSRIVHLPIQDRQGEATYPGLQWFGKRKRSTRPSKEAGSRNLEAGSRNLDCKRDASLIDDETPGDAYISSTVSAQHKKAFSHVELCKDAGSGEDKDNILKVERDELENRTLPESSKDSLPSDSRAESPSSPLPSLQLECRAFLVGGQAASSAFQRVVPVRPVRKPSPLLIKAKIEDMNYDVQSHPAVPAAKLTVKRKPRLCKPMIPPASAKVEETVDASPLTVFVQQKPDLVLKEEKGTGCENEVGIALAELGVESAPPLVTGESRQVGFRVVNKPKPALTEMEKEARRLRRVQANRESARQTIRRKQILCEELTQKAASLALENESMKQKKEFLMQEFYSLREKNRHLKEQVSMQASSKPGHESLSQSTSVPSQRVSLPALQVPMLPYGGVPLQSFVWAFALAQATAASQASALQNGEMTSGMDYNLGTYGNGTISGLWMGSGGTRQHQSPPFIFPHPSAVAPSAQLSASCAAEQQTINNSPGSCSPVSASVAQKEASSTSVSCVENVPVPSMGTPCECLEEADCDPGKSNVRDAPENVCGAGLNASSACLQQLHVRGSLSQPGAAVAVSSFRSQTSKAKAEVDEGVGSSAASGNLGRCLGSKTPQLTRAVSSYVIPLNGSGIGGLLDGPPQTGSYTGRKASAAAIAAAEARRRRKELTRSKFLQSRAFRLHC